MSPQVPRKSTGRHVFSLPVFIGSSSGSNSGLGWASRLLWCFLSRTQNCQKRLLASSCVSVRVAFVCPCRTTRLPRTNFRDVIFEHYMLNLETESAATTCNTRHDTQHAARRDRFMKFKFQLRYRRFATGGPRECEQENGCIEFGTL